MNGMANISSNDEPLRELALFAGAGGGILGGKLLGWRTVCAVEINEYAASVLVARQNDGCLEPFPIWDDVTTFDGTEWAGRVDVVSGGFPCQDISVAGKGAGLSGERSGLWTEFARIIREVRPRFAFVENSPALTSRGIDRVLGDLAEMGFNARWGVFSAGRFGARHQRERMWIAASNNRKERIQRSVKTTIPRFEGVPWGEDVGSVEDLRKRPDLLAPGLCRTTHDVADYMDRIAAIGNGQVPIVAATAWRILSGE